MNDINIENVAALVTKPVIKQKVEEEKPLPPIAALIEERRSGLVDTKCERAAKFLRGGDGSHSGVRRL